MIPISNKLLVSRHFNHLHFFKVGRQLVDAVANDSKQLTT